MEKFDALQPLQMYWVRLSNWSQYYVFILDVNECTENVCAQSCTNTNGSYTCSCYAGYTLESDNTCEGMYRERVCPELHQNQW